MGEYSHTIEVDVPVRTAYNQWTQVESFPQFMDGVEQVRQVGDAATHWAVEIGGIRREFDAQIVEQIPDQRIAWTSADGPWQSGTIEFDPIGDGRTRVWLRMDYEPHGFVEKVGDKLGIVSDRVQGDLERFKEFIEERGAEPGAWRGEVHRR